MILCPAGAFPKNVSGKTHSAENPKESSMPAMSFFPVTIKGDFDGNKLEKSRIVPKQDGNF